GSPTIGATAFIYRAPGMPFKMGDGDKLVPAMGPVPSFRKSQDRFVWLSMPFPDVNLWVSGLDGSNVRLLAKPLLLSLPGIDPDRLAVDDDYAYFWDQDPSTPGAATKLRRVALDGTGSVQDLATAAGGGALYFAVGAGYVFFTDGDAELKRLDPKTGTVTFVE